MRGYVLSHLVPADGSDAQIGCTRTRFSDFPLGSSSISTFVCQEVLDLCAIAMNTAGIPLVFTGAIQSRDDIHYISSLIALASGDFKPLVIVTQSLRMQARSGSEFVSWVNQPIFVPGEARIATPFPESISSVTTEY